MNKKLSLNKEVIATLNNDSMNQVKGGETAISQPGGNCGTVGTCGRANYELTVLTAILEFHGLCNCMWD